MTTVFLTILPFMLTFTIASLSPASSQKSFGNHPSTCDC
jgi:hypothetical protein